MNRRARQRAQTRPVYANAIERAITGAAKLPTEDVQRTTRGMLVALQEFAAGRYCREHWASMADATNVALELCTLGICSDEASRQLLDDAQQVLGDVAVRAQQRGTWTLHARELEQLREALQRHGIQLGFCSLSEYERAVEAVRRKHAQYAAGNAPKDAIVITGALA